MRSKDIFEFLFFIFLIYIMIGLFSLLAVAEGEDIRFMPFWHEPWKWLVNLLRYLFSFLLFLRPF